MKLPQPIRLHAALAFDINRASLDNCIWHGRVIGRRMRGPYEECFLLHCPVVSCVRNEVVLVSTGAPTISRIEKHPTRPDANVSDLYGVPKH